MKTYVDYFRYLCICSFVHANSSLLFSDNVNFQNLKDLTVRQHSWQHNSKLMGWAFKRAKKVDLPVLFLCLKQERRRKRRKQRSLAWYFALSLSGHFPSAAVRWTRLYPKLIAARYNDRCEICLRARHSSEVIKTVKWWYNTRLSGSCKLLMRPPNQLSAVTKESPLFRPQWIVNAQLGPIFW